MFFQLLLDLLLIILALGAIYGLVLVGYGLFVFGPQMRSRKAELSGTSQNGHKSVPPFTTSIEEDPRDALKNQNVCATIILALAAEGKKVTDCRLPDEAHIPYKNVR